MAELRWERPGAPVEIALVPIWLDEVGEPQFCAGKSAEAAFQRLTSFSRRFGTRLEWRDGKLAIDSTPRVGTGP